jgi:hypothetical protein
MATQLDPKDFQVQEQFVRLRLQIEESEKFSAETRKLVAEMTKTQSDLKYQPWFILFQGVLATAALMGAGVAFAKLFLS